MSMMVFVRLIVDIMEGEIDAKQIDKDLIAERLAKENDEGMGRLFHQIASEYENIDMGSAREFASKKNGHHLSPTCLSFANAGMAKNADRPELFIYSGSKDSVIVKWDFWTGMKAHVFTGSRKQKEDSRKKAKIEAVNKNVEHIGHYLDILCMDASSDGKYLVSLIKSIYIVLRFADLFISCLLMISF
jgi:ribosomal RNA-processing protein 9